MVNHPHETLIRHMPYMGLVPYDEADAPFLFGREAEGKSIVVNLMAYRLTLLYGPSGVGKSSLLRAGVIRKLHEIEDSLVVYFSSWQGDPLGSLIHTVQSSVATRVGGQTAQPVPSRSGLAESLLKCTETLGGELFIILDQFEDYFKYHPEEKHGATFAQEFPRAVNSPDLWVNFLISIREDSLAKLDHFKASIPNLLDNSLRLRHLDLESARLAIEGPVREYNAMRGDDQEQVKLESALVDQVLEETSTGRIVLADNAAEWTTTRQPEIEPSLLQLVMSCLWQEELGAGSRVLRLETLRRLGGARGILKTNLDRVMEGLKRDERTIAAEMFSYMITPSGERVSVTAEDLAEWVHRGEIAELRSLLDKLVGDRIVRVIIPHNRGELVQYEIVHDVLASAILAWLKANKVEGKEKATIKRLRWAVAGLVAFSALALIAAIIAWIKSCP